MHRNIKKILCIFVYITPQKKIKIKMKLYMIVKNTPDW